VVLIFSLILFGVLLASAIDARAQDPFIGEIRMFAGNYAPNGWALCNGQFLPISKTPHSSRFWVPLTEATG
jgi:hypothetical protein